MFLQLNLIKQTLVSVLLAASMIFSVQVQAHGGLALAEDLCILTVGPYTMHFTGYQPLTQEEEFCEDIPEVGKTVVALDYINDELRPLTTEVRIIRDTGSEENLDDITVYHLPPKVYPSASIAVEHVFPEKGKFVGLVTVTGGAEDYVSRFPFSVGEGRPTSWVTIILPVVIIVGAGAFFFSRRRKVETTDTA
ncbi:hypothetical protein SAMN05216419_10683 [Nitrosomonas cryotolerans]|uniref:PEP-CTERM protein-sorting domain-containing protein n=1 Tax=Nitrosomonas cryotolerans ATCC 49181 TaxID=1131553 RepID=A0A1N6H0W7_9PROT|nr:hypothetical protein [Nitrosomonas cryotolerans]SFQ12380.1 hypothetical protein SAMN05216419_10683 [Nitrosomonas cryotolerans]SIO13305.1 hypothetical protein SAMN02743940_0959 [Nitrosomonas cryotolerans ATCC 49181]